LRKIGAYEGLGSANMVQRVATVAFEGIEVRPVDVQVQVAAGMPAFAIVGLPDKAVSEARERVRSALIASGLALPARRITINLAPADLPKEGSHYDLPIALGLMAAIGAIPHDALSGFTVLGELGLDGSIATVAGVLPAAIGANARGEGLICPAACGPEAAWASPEIEIIAAGSLIQLANHFKGTQVLSRPQPKILEASGPVLDLADIKGQESAKRALEVAAAGGHNLLMVGPPGAGKSMLAARLPSILPPLAPAELLEVSMVASVAGQIEGGALTNRRPFRAPHHSASMPALVGGGLHARPGEISLAHHGVLFLDELPEFQPQALDSLRQPLETGEVSIARANHRVTYPARFMLVAAMNPCRCGKANEPGFSCRRGPNTRCTADYQTRISGPLLDRIDLQIEVPAVTAADLILPPPAEGSREIAERVALARDRPSRPLCCDRAAAYPQQCCRVGRGPGRRGETGQQRADAIARSRRCDAALGARLSPRAARCPHARRSRRRRQSRPRASGGGLVLSRARRRGAAGGLARSCSAPCSMQSARCSPLGRDLARPVAVDRAAHADRRQEFLPRLGMIAKHAEHAARHHGDARPVHAARGHALVRRFGDHGDAVRLEHRVEAGGDLGGHFLLDLQAAGIDLDQPRQLRNPDHAVARQIADMHPADDRRQVMLAMRFEADVAQHHDFVIAAGFLKGAFKIVARIVLVTGEPFLVGAHDPRRGGNKALALGIVTRPAD
jgi:magnesium chelatase family protein